MHENRARNTIGFLARFRTLVYTTLNQRSTGTDVGYPSVPDFFKKKWFPRKRSLSGVNFHQVLWLGMALPLILISILRWWVRLMCFSNLIIYSKMEYWCSKEITSRSQNQPRSHFENDWSFSPGCIFRLNFKIQITVRLRGVQWL